LKRLSILGSSGSIGTSTLDVVDAFPGEFEVVAIAGGSNIDRLEQQVGKYRPECVAVGSAEGARDLAARIDGRTRVLHGPDGLMEVGTHPDADIVVSALVGALGLRPTYAALEAGRTVALATKRRSSWPASG